MSMARAVCRTVLAARDARGAMSEELTVADTGGVVRTALRPNSLGLVGVTMQAITHIAPAIAALFLGVGGP